MKRNSFFKVMMVMVMMMTSVNTFGNGNTPRNHNDNKRTSHTEYSDNSRNHDNSYNRNNSHGRDNSRNRDNSYNRNNSHGRDNGYNCDNHYNHEVRPHAPRPVRVMHHPKVDCHGYLHGWEGRVRFVNSRWGYMRDNRWMWYDTYFEPEYYYAHPVVHFSTHLTREEAAVVAGVTAAVAVGTLVSALCH